ncbi:Nre family DNA repair protein [Candidatus Woesearchaeota archaeon]|nr:Nre family DNA repair protein [Candidatus Woesearchaeota archaeon]
MNIPCIKCKGSNPQYFCGRSFCPIIAKSEAMWKVGENNLKEQFAGSSPSPFVGRYGYPKVNVGVLSVDVADSAVYDAPRHWAEHNFGIQQIADYRSSLINSRFVVNIKASSKFLEVSQEVGMASKPVELEVKLDRKPQFRMKANAITPPMGPNAELKGVEITANPKIHYKVERAVDDTDYKAADAIVDLYKNSFDENFLTRLLSVGNIGMKKNRKLVPTRWSITAVDDTVGKELINEIKDFKQGDYCAFFGSYLGNYYLVLMFPEVWSYELFEMYMPKASWNPSEELQYSTDHEGYSGRKEYAYECAGGYYAARLAILEKLKRMKRQSSVLALRFITGEYYLPLGVWVVREATRKAMSSQPFTFESQELMMSYAKALIKKKFGYNLEALLPKSILLKEIKHQSKLTKYI